MRDEWTPNFTATATVDGELFINDRYLHEYRCADQGLILPLFSEYTWPEWIRATLYCACLLYCFMGVAIIADIFMGSIEKITSKTKKVYLTTSAKDEPEVYEVRIWSDAVANLTLMALGSSAPEILLSCIEVIGNNFNAGKLGPDTIVGSAAFNLFVISAVCVVSIPAGEDRKIKDLKVFGVTAVFSLIAYIWLLIILVGFSANQVQIWEACVTLAMFPLLVLLAWLAEKNLCGAKSQEEQSKQMELGQIEPGDKLVKDSQYFRDGRLDREGLVRFIKEVKKYPGLTDEDAAVLAASKLVESQSHSRMWYRVGAVRSMTGGRKTQPQLTMKLKEVYNALNEHPEAPTLGDVPTIKAFQNAVIDFHASSCAVMENIGVFKVEICRTGRLDTRVSVRVETIEGTATETQDYVPINEVVTFGPGEEKLTIDVEIVNDNQWEPDEEFYLRMSLLNEQKERENVQLGRVSIMEIVILNDDEPGTISFARRGVLVKESVGSASIPVVRRNGADGEVSVHWRTIDKNAINGKDYRGGEGVLTFKHTEVELSLEIPIIDDMSAEKDEHFEVELYESTGGAKIGAINRTAVTITNDDDFDTVLSKMMSLTSANMDALQVHHETYLGQLKDALNVNGGDLENATCSDYFMHFFTFGWKILFALVPPPSILGGWLCFFVSLASIGLLTAIIGDLASIFGCLVYLKPSVTAITFVALGTSLPDTFASRAAAVQERHADSAIGNITGSNSVNVFLGLGLPWLIASLHHYYHDTKFMVQAGDLGFSVGLFTALSVVCLGVIVARRLLPICGKAELGGPAIAKNVCGAFMVSLWFIYVTVASLKAYEFI